MMRAVVAGGNLNVYGLAFGRDNLGGGAMLVLIAGEDDSGDVEKDFSFGISDSKF